MDTLHIINDVDNIFPYNHYNFYRTNIIIKTKNTNKIYAGINLFANNIDCEILIKEIIILNSENISNILDILFVYLNITYKFKYIIINTQNIYIKNYNICLDINSMKKLMFDTNDIEIDIIKRKQIIDYFIKICGSKYSNTHIIITKKSKNINKELYKKKCKISLHFKSNAPLVIDSGIIEHNDNQSKIISFYRNIYLYEETKQCAPTLKYNQIMHTYNNYKTISILFDEPLSFISKTHIDGIQMKIRIDNHIYAHTEFTSHPIVNDKYILNECTVIPQLSTQYHISSDSCGADVRTYYGLSYYASENDYINSNYSIEEQKTNKYTCENIELVNMMRLIKTNNKNILHDEIIIPQLIDIDPHPANIEVINMKSLNGNIYILIEREFIKSKEKVYKIGRTFQPMYKRLSGYSKGSMLLFVEYVENCVEMETKIIKKFKEKFIQKREYGLESFEGDINDIIECAKDMCKTGKKINLDIL